MIKFFRKIRYKLMSENKNTKYFKYAIGEIVLVVIGILIALQINNWNVARVETNQEIKILKELKNDLNTNLAEITEMITDISNRKKAANLILSYIKEQKKVNDTLKLAFELLPLDGIFNNAQTAYKYIENQGINIISNDSLRIRITVMYEKDFLNITNRENMEKQIILTEFTPILSPLLITTTSIWKNPNPDTNEDIFPTIPNKPINMKAFKDNKVINAIVHLRNWISLRGLRLKETQTKLQLLIKATQEEIKKLES